MYQVVVLDLGGFFLPEAWRTVNDLSGPLLSSRKVTFTILNIFMNMINL